MYWSSHGWKSGWNSHGWKSAPDHPFWRPWSLPSYAVLDQLILAANQNLPNLKHINIIGHSAGGQLTNRFAELSTVPLACSRNIHFSFVVANPSSYGWLNEQRPNSFGTPALVSNSTASECPRYNQWK